MRRAARGAEVALLVAHRMKRVLNYKVFERRMGARGAVPRGGARGTDPAPSPQPSPAAGGAARAQRRQ